MNIYQGLLFLHGFRVLPEDANAGESAADGRCGAAAPMARSAVVTLQGNAAVPPVAGAVAGASSPLELRSA